MRSSSTVSTRAREADQYFQLFDERVVRVSEVSCVRLLSS